MCTPCLYTRSYVIAQLLRFLEQVPTGARNSSAKHWPRVSCPLRDYRLESHRYFARASFFFSQLVGARRSYTLQKIKQTKQNKTNKQKTKKGQNSSLVAKPSLCLSQTVYACDLHTASEERCERDYGSLHGEPLLPNVVAPEPRSQLCT